MEICSLLLNVMENEKFLNNNFTADSSKAARKNNCLYRIVHAWAYEFYVLMARAISHYCPDVFLKYHSNIKFVSPRDSVWYPLHITWHTITINYVPHCKYTSIFYCTSVYFQSFVLQVYTSNILLYKCIFHEKSSVNLSEEDILSVSSFHFLLRFSAVCFSLSFCLIIWLLFCWKRERMAGRWEVAVTQRIEHFISIYSNSAW